MESEPVFLTGFKTGKIPVPTQRSHFVEIKPGLSAPFIEQTQLDSLGHTGEEGKIHAIAVISGAEQLIEGRRPEDIGHCLWTTFQRVQENVIRGGQPGRSAQGRRLQTRPVGSIDRGVSLNRALWMLAEEMRKLKA